LYRRNSEQTVTLTGSAAAKEYGENSEAKKASARAGMTKYLMAE
jgi:hypothetical protein